MKKIKLTQDQWALVDDEDYDRLNEHKWIAQREYKSKRADKFYVVRNFPIDSTSGKKWKTIALHREITNAPKGMVVDHINGDSLDNRKENLRVCTHQENQMNRRINKDNTSGYKGVYYDAKNKKNSWYAKIMFNYKLIHIGYYKTKEEAARAYDQKAIELFGEFAQLNFPEEWMNVHGVMRYDRKRDKRE